MAYRFHRSIEQHSGTGEPHNLPHPFAHSRLVAMYGTFLARTFLLSEGTVIKTGMCIAEQFFALRTKSCILLFLPAIETNHDLYCSLFLSNTWLFISFHRAKIINGLHILQITSRGMVVVAGNYAYLCGMKEYRLTDWLPTTKKEVELRGWDELDVILFSGDAYVDHPSFGAAVIGRILEAEGLRVAIIPQPNWRDDLRDFKKLGRPRLFFGISPGCMDSMVNKYTANKRLRSDDAYTPDARPDMRPDYPSIVYTQILKKLYPDVPVVLGGIEASMRRVTHYDYWQDKLMKSILVESGADLLIYGMGEKPVVELIRRFNERSRL